MRVEAEVAAGLGGELELLDRPGLALGGLAAHLGRGEAVERRVIGRMHRDQLALQVGRQLGDLDAASRQRAGELVAIVLALGGALEVDAAARPRSGSGRPCSRARPPSRRSPSSELNGAASPTNCARKIAGPLMVRMMLSSDRPVRRRNRSSRVLRGSLHCGRDEGHAAHALGDAGQQRGGLAPQQRGEVAVKIGEGFQIALRMASGCAGAAPRIGSQRGVAATNYLRAAVTVVKQERIGFFLPPDEPAAFTIDPNAQAIQLADLDLRSE